MTVPSTPAEHAATALERKLRRFPGVLMAVEEEFDALVALAARADELERENEAMRGRIEELERQIHHKPYWLEFRAAKARADELERENERLNARWQEMEHPFDKSEYDAMHRRAERAEKALRAVLEVASVAHEGDPWYCENAEIDVEAAFALARAALGEQP